MSQKTLYATPVWCLCILTVAGCPPVGGGGDAGNATNDNATVNVNGNDNSPDNDNSPGNDNSQDNDNSPDNANGSVAGLPLPISSTGAFATSGTCAACHQNLSDDAGNDVSIDDAWRVTMMANAARDPLFLAVLSSEVLHTPGLKEMVEDLCATCHMPMARTQAVIDGEETLVQDDGFLSPDHPLHVAAMDGISCTLCHQIQDDFLDDPEGSFGGGYQVDTTTQSPDRIVFGPYGEPQSPPIMQAASGFQPVLGEQLSDSGLCGICHTVFAPSVDAEGNVVGERPEQTQYLEWLHSDFGDGLGGDDRSCQGCHMVTADTPVVITSVPPNLQPRTPFFQHQFLGGNVFMLRLLRDNIETLGLTASTADFDTIIALTERYLREKTAVISIADSNLSDGTLSVTFEITNKAGHKFPTGGALRRAWIHVTVTDAAGQVVFESGAPQPDGKIAGDDADEDASTLEPHYDVITTPDQVQVYQALMANTDGEITHSILRGASFVKDNRLLPQGFDKSTANSDIAVQGGAAEDDDFVAGGDRISYEIDVAGRTAPFAVTAKLLYQAISFGAAEDLLKDSTELIDRFRELYEPMDKAPALVSTVSTTLQ